MDVDAEIMDALFLHLENEQPFSPPYRVEAPLVSFKPTNKEIYLRGSFLPNQPPSTGINRNSFVQHIGIFQVLVSFPIDNEGLLSPLRICGGIVSMFHMARLLHTANGLKVKISREPWIAPVLSHPVRPTLPVSVPYECSAPAQ